MKAHVLFAYVSCLALPEFSHPPVSAKKVVNIVLNMLPQAMPHAMRRAIDIFLVLTAVLLALSLGYRHIIIDAADPYRCNALQANGRWVGGHGSSNESNKHLYWQPPGCLLHEYNAREIQSCLQCNRLLFVGDSTIRQVYWATVRRLDTQRAAEMSLSAPKHGNLKFGQGCVEVEFWWDPFLNSTMLTKEIKHYRSYMESSNSTGTAAMLVGTGLWHAKTLGPMFLPGFKQSIDSVAASLAHTPTGKNAVALPPSRRDGSAYLVLFAPIPLPIQSRLDPAHAATMTPERIQGMNEYLRSAASKFSIEVLWSYSFMTGQRDSAFETDGYHAVKMIADRQADVFLNMRCNSQPSLEHYPFDKTCCNFQPRVYREQLLLLLAATITALSALFSTRKPRSDDDSGTNVLRAAGLLAMAGLYCFVADRTPIFDKFRKVPNQQTFLLLTALVMFGGLLSIRTSTKKPANTPGKLTRTAAVHTFLPRDQTDEWKGWMQFLILIYHYTGMSSVLWVYQIARLLVASYLFMTGYGHTAYFLKTNDLSLSRVVSVLVRLNLLSCLLAYLMRTDYNFYYFPTLSSFWFLVVYFTVRIRHEPNVVPRLLTLKIVASAIVVQLLLRTPGLLEFVFKFLLETCNMNVNVDEFRFRLSLDAYVVYFGMFAAVLYLQFTGGLPCSTTCLATQIKRVPDAVHVLADRKSVV